ncbi:MAG: ASKHA domain-containing protein [Actinomycetota bacterium]
MTGPAEQPAGGAAADMHRVVFTPSGQSGTVADGTPVLTAARDLGVDLDSVCGGRGICGRCQVEPSFGRFDKWAITAARDHLSSPGGLEATYQARKELADGRRLGCDLRILGDAVIDVPASSQIHRQVVRKDVDLAGLVVDPVVTLHYLELAPLDAEDGTSITERITDALATDWSIELVGFETGVLAHLHRAAADDRLTVALGRAGPDGNRSVRGVWPGFVDRVVGVAVDVGSTTVAGHLCDLATGEVLASAGRMNPQIRFGEDLMSRVSYVMMNPDGRVELTAAVRRALDELVGELLDEAAAGTGDSPDDADTLDRYRVLDVVLVGNPVMHHLFLGIDPSPLGQSPFPLATDTAVNGRAADVGIDAPLASLYVAPCVAGHVGADTAAAVLAEGPHRDDSIQLLVDVGTNAEIVLGNAERLFAASSPTGPAFEGAQISAGQRATAGAIERVRIDAVTLEPRFRVIGSELWSDEDGFAEATASTGITGICGSGIIEVVAELFLAGIVDADGLVVDPAGRAAAAVAAGSEPPTGLDRIEADDRTFAYRLTDTIRVTQGDVRAIQLAKAALRAGIDLLLEHAAIDTVDEIRLAGAFGAHIDPVHAMVLGLVPDCEVGRVRSTGNSAGSGAVRALLAASQRAEMEDVVRRITKIETATEPRFQDLFVAALALPHRDAPNPLLGEVVTLPERTTASAGGTAGAEGTDANGGGRRRRRGRRARTTTKG